MSDILENNGEPLQVLEWETLPQWGYKGVRVFSDTHVGQWQEFHRTERMEASLNCMIEDAIRRKLLPIFNGDTFDFYPHVTEENRLRDGALMTKILQPLHDIPGNHPIAIFGPGNHDPIVGRGEVEKYTGLPSERTPISAQFFALGNEVLVNHGDDLEVRYLSKLIEQIRREVPEITTLSQGLTKNYRDRILTILNHDQEQVRQQQAGDDSFYRPLYRKLQKLGRFRWYIENISYGMLNANGLLGRWVEERAAQSKSKSASRLMRGIGEVLGMTLAKHAAKVGKALGFRVVLCGHDHTAQLFQLNGTLYVNTGSIFQTGVQDTCVSMVEDGGALTIELQRFRQKTGDMQTMDVVHLPSQTNGNL